MKNYECINTIAQRLYDTIVEKYGTIRAGEHFLHISRQQLYNYFNGTTRLTDEILKDFAQLLKVPYEYLAGKTDINSMSEFEQRKDELENKRNELFTSAITQILAFGNTEYCYALWCYKGTLTQYQNDLATIKPFLSSDVKTYADEFNNEDVNVNENLTLLIELSGIDFTHDNELIEKLNKTIGGQISMYQKLIYGGASSYNAPVYMTENDFFKLTATLQSQLQSTCSLWLEHEAFRDNSDIRILNDGVTYYS